MDDKQPAPMFYELNYSIFLFFWFRVKCLKQGIKNRNSVLNRVGKSAIFVLNRVRVWGAGPHLPTQGYIEYPPPPIQIVSRYSLPADVPWGSFVTHSMNAWHDKRTPKDVYGEATPAKAVTCMDNNISYKFSLSFLPFPAAVGSTCRKPSPLQCFWPGFDIPLY